MGTIRVRATLIEELLGSQPGNADIHRDFIASKAPDGKTREEEVAEIGVDAEIEKGMTVFYRKDGVPGLFAYQIQGFLKEAFKVINDSSADMQEVMFGQKLKKITAYKKKVDNLIFIYPIDDALEVNKFLPLHLPEGGEITSLQRPLRGQTAQGERISLANSECAPSGTIIEFKILFANAELEDYIRGALNYGKRKGFGQWRNSGMGRFLWDELDANGNVIGGNFHAVA